MCRVSITGLSPGVLKKKKHLLFCFADVPHRRTCPTVLYVQLQGNRSFSPVV